MDARLRGLALRTGPYSLGLIHLFSFGATIPRVHGFAVIARQGRKQECAAKRCEDRYKRIRDDRRDGGRFREVGCDDDEGNPGIAGSGGHGERSASASPGSAAQPTNDKT